MAPVQCRFEINKVAAAVKDEKQSGWKNLVNNDEKIGMEEISRRVRRKYMYIHGFGSALI